MNGANSDPTGYAGGGHGLRGENPEIGMYMIIEKYRLTELVKSHYKYRPIINIFSLVLHPAARRAFSFIGEPDCSMCNSKAVRVMQEALALMQTHHQEQLAAVLETIQDVKKVASDSQVCGLFFI